MHPYLCIAHRLSSYLCICKNFVLFLPFNDLLPFYKDLAYEIDSNLCGLMFFEAPKLKTGIGIFNKKFILDLERFQIKFSLKDFIFQLQNILKMNLDFNLDFKSIKFPVPYPSKLTFIMFPAKSRTVYALLTGQYYCNTFQNPILQYKVQTLSVKLTRHLTSHGSEAIRSLAEYSKNLNWKLQSEANKLFKLIKFPVTPGHNIDSPKLTYSKWGRVLNCIAGSSWNIREFIFCHSRSQWTLPKRLDFNEIELQPENFIITDQDTLYRTDEDDEYIIYPTHNSANSYLVLTAYKQVGKKIHPVSTQFPMDCQVTCHIPEDPLLTLPSLPAWPPEFILTAKFSLEWLQLAGPDQEKPHLLICGNKFGSALVSREQANFGWPTKISWTQWDIS